MLLSEDICRYVHLYNCTMFSFAFYYIHLFINIFLVSNAHFTKKFYFVSNIESGVGKYSLYYFHGYLCWYILWNSKINDFKNILCFMSSLKVVVIFIILFRHYSSFFLFSLLLCAFNFQFYFWFIRLFFYFEFFRCCFIFLFNNTILCILDLTCTIYTGL